MADRSCCFFTGWSLFLPNFNAKKINLLEAFLCWQFHGTKSCIGCKSFFILVLKFGRKCQKTPCKYQRLGLNALTLTCFQIQNWEEDCQWCFWSAAISQRFGHWRGLWSSCSLFVSLFCYNFYEVRVQVHLISSYFVLILIICWKIFTLGPCNQAWTLECQNSTGALGILLLVEYFFFNWKDLSQDLK